MIYKLLYGLALTTILTPVSTSLLAETRLISGEVAAQQSQSIIAPMSLSWNLRIDWMAEEGTLLKPGDLAVRFDNSANDRAILQTKEQHEDVRSQGIRTIARLEKEKQLADFDAKIAAINLQKAQSEARIDARFIGELNYADNQLLLTRAQQALIKAQDDANDRQLKLKEAQLKLELDQSIVENDLLWSQRLTEGNAIYANIEGFMLYRKHPWNRSKFRAGDNVQTSFYVAEVVNVSSMYIRIFINAVDLPGIELEQAVKVFLDAYPKQSYRGKITELMVQGESRKEWGKGLYMQGLVEFEPDQELPALMPGMSALVELEL